MKSCAVCGCAMTWEHPSLKGHVMCSSCDIDGWHICHDCMVEHCCSTDCSACGYGRESDCRFTGLKENYTSDD